MKQSSHILFLYTLTMLSFYVRPMQREGVDERTAPAIEAVESGSTELQLESVAQAQNIDTFTAGRIRAQLEQRRQDMRDHSDEDSVTRFIAFALVLVGMEMASESEFMKVERIGILDAIEKQDIERFKQILSQENFKELHIEAKKWLLKFAIIFPGTHQVRIIGLLIQSGISIKGDDNPLHTLAYSDYSQRTCTKIALLLFKMGACIDGIPCTEQEKTYFKSCPLLFALAKKKYYLAHLFLKKGADVNVCLAGGHTPLTKAVSHGDIEAILLLLRHGAQANHADDAGNTPMYRVLDSESADFVKIAQFLMRHGALLSHKNNNGESVLFYILGDGGDYRADLDEDDPYRGKHLDLIKFFVAQGLSIAEKNRQGLTAWQNHFLCTKHSGFASFLEAACFDHKDDCLQCEVAHYLLTHLDLSAEDIRHVSFHSFNKGHFGLVRLYACRPALFKGVAVATLTDRNGYTPLHYAAATDDLDLAKILLSLDVPIDAVSSEKCTPLIIAAMFRAKRVLKLLLREGADVHARDKFQNTPLLATFSNFSDFYEVILSPEDTAEASNFIDELLSNHISDGDVLKIITRLFKAGARLDDQNKDGKTALMKAIFFGRAFNDYIVRLVQLGCPLHPRSMGLTFEELVKEINDTVESIGPDVDPEVYSSILFEPFELYNPKILGLVKKALEDDKGVAQSLTTDKRGKRSVFGYLVDREGVKRQNLKQIEKINKQ